MLLAAANVPCTYSRSPPLQRVVSISATTPLVVDAIMGHGPDHSLASLLGTFMVLAASLGLASSNGVQAAGANERHASLSHGVPYAGAVPAP
jgi:hypothetical protein